MHIYIFRYVSTSYRFYVSSYVIKKCCVCNIFIYIYTHIFIYLHICIYCPYMCSICVHKFAYAC